MHSQRADRVAMMKHDDALRREAHSDRQAIGVVGEHGVFERNVAVKRRCFAWRRARIGKHFGAGWRIFCQHLQLVS